MFYLFGDASSPAEENLRCLLPPSYHYALFLLLQIQAKDRQKLPLIIQVYYI